MACPLMDGDPEHLIWKLDQSWVSNPPALPPLPVSFIHKIFGTNFSFNVNNYTMEKVQFPFFRSFFSVF